MDLSIRDMTSNNFKSKIIDGRLPTIPFNLVCYGKSMSGKTNALLNLIFWYKKQFKDRIIVLTSSLDGSLISLKQNLGAVVLTDILNENGENVLERLINYQTEQKENGEKLKGYLVYLDDWISDSSWNKKRGLYDKLYSMGRHLNISIITTAQQYTMAPASIRRLALYIMCFKISNSREKKLFIDETCNVVDMNEREFEKVFDDITREKYGFIYIDGRNSTFSNKF